MGSLMGREIIQTRTWIDPNEEPVPNLNFKYTYPITVFEAVLTDFDEESENLNQVLRKIDDRLNHTQTIIPGRPANFIMTYGGIPGAVGEIEISRAIPWDLDRRTHSRIPTEKAVGDFLYTIGLLDEDGKIKDPGELFGRTIRWSDIIGRPHIYYVLGNNDDGFIAQSALSLLIQE
jgi:hypothetical protein